MLHRKGSAGHNTELHREGKKKYTHPAVRHAIHSTGLIHTFAIRWAYTGINEQPSVGIAQSLQECAANYVPYSGDYVPYCMGAQFLERLLSQCLILVTTVKGIGERKKKAFTCDIHSYTRTHSEQRPAVITSFLCGGNEHFSANGDSIFPHAHNGRTLPLECL